MGICRSEEVSMNLLIVSTVRFRFNGVTSVILNYYRSMDRTGINIDIVVPNKISDAYRNEFEQDGTKVYQLNRKKPFRYFFELKRILQQKNYDVVHIHGNSSLMLLDIMPAVLCKIPVRIVHSHNTTCNHVFLHHLLGPLFKMCYTNSFACGEEAGKWLYGKKIFIVLKNGINTGAYAYDLQIRKKIRTVLHVENEILLGHIGNFIEQKNHTFLIDLFADLLKINSNYKLLLISDGVLMESIKKKVNDLNISDHVIFLGKTSDVNQYLQGIDIFLLPSLYEGLPVALIEAQSAGLPCLVADTVSKESDLTKTEVFLPIDSTDIWVNAIEKVRAELSEHHRMEQSETNIKMIKECGYDAIKSGNVLRNYYFEFLNHAKGKSGAV